jgi:hypothetical protein
VAKSGGQSSKEWPKMAKNKGLPITFRPFLTVFVICEKSHQK